MSVCLSRGDEFDLDLSIKCKEITDENATLVSFRFFKERHPPPTLEKSRETYTCISRIGYA